MHLLPRNSLQDLGLLAAIALLVAGALLFLRLLWQGRRGTPGWTSPAAVARLQVRAWQPADACLLLCALLLPMAPALPGIFFPPAPADVPAPAVPSFAPYFAYYALVVAGVALAARRTGTGIGAALGITRQNAWPSLLAGVELGLATLPPVILTAWLSDGVLRAIGVPVVQQPVFDLLADPNLGGLTQILLAAVAVLAAPLAEEAVFRGVILPAVLRNCRWGYALLLVNVLFALLHLHPTSFLPLLTVGICLSLGMLDTGSLLTPVVMHAIFNGEMMLLFYTC
jgi:membrane protease YdiL (CAAX protease family)